MPDATVNLVMGETREIAGTLTGTASLTVNAATWALENSSGVVPGYGGACSSIDPPGLTVNAWAILNTTALPVGIYNMIFTMNLSNGEIITPIVRVVVADPSM